MLDICNINPNATKSEALKRSIVWSCDINHISIRKRAGISPTRTVYMSHLIFIFVMLNLPSFPSAIYPYMYLIFGPLNFRYIGNYTHILCEGQVPRFVI